MLRNIHTRLMTVIRDASLYQLRSTGSQSPVLVGLPSLQKIGSIAMI